MHARRRPAAGSAAPCDGRAWPRPPAAGAPPLKTMLPEDATNPHDDSRRAPAAPRGARAGPSRARFSIWYLCSPPARAQPARRGAPRPLRPGGGRGGRTALPFSAPSCSASPHVWPRAAWSARAPPSRPGPPLQSGARAGTAAAATCHAPRWPGIQRNTLQAALWAGRARHLEPACEPHVPLRRARPARPAARFVLIRFGLWWTPPTYAPLCLGPPARSRAHSPPPRAHTCGREQPPQ